MYFYPGGERCVVDGSDAVCEPRSMFGDRKEGGMERVHSECNDRDQNTCRSCYRKDVG